MIEHPVTWVAAALVGAAIVLALSLRLNPNDRARVAETPDHDPRGEGGGES